MAIQFWYLLFFARESTFVTLFTAFTNFIVIYCFANWSILSLLVAVVVAALQSPHAASSCVVLEHALRAFVNLGFVNHFDRSDKTACAGACSAAAKRVRMSGLDVWLCACVCGVRVDVWLCVRAFGEGWIIMAVDCICQQDRRSHPMACAVAASYPEVL